MRRSGRGWRPRMGAEEQVRELGKKLKAAAPAPADALAKLLEEAAECLQGIEQSPGSSMMDAIQPCLKALTRDEFLKHEVEDVKVLLATCFSEITRITCPVAPYNDDVLGDIFYLIVGTFHGLSDSNSQSFGRRVAILETVAICQACLLMLDLECDDLITGMFQAFLGVVSDRHEQNIVKSMETVMTLTINESYDIQESLLRVLLSALGPRKTGAALSARKLARNVIEHSAGKLEPYIKKFLTSSLAGDGCSSNDQVSLHGIILDIYQCAPNVVKVVVPYITRDLLADEVDTRSKAVELLGEIFSLPGAPILESFKSLFAEFLRRLADRAVEIRVSVVEHLKSCLMSNPFRPEASEIIKVLCDRLLDNEEIVRKGVVAALCDVACHSPDAITADTVKVVAERVRDKSLAVKCYTMERLADIYKLYCQKDGSTKSDDFEWIPGKILRCLYDKDLRPESIDSIFCGSLLPPEFPTKGRAEHDPSIANLVGHRIKVWWPSDNKFYEGVVESYDSSTKKHKVLYDDGDVELLNLAEENWTLIESKDSSVKKQKKDHPGKNQGRPESIDSILCGSLLPPEFPTKGRAKQCEMAVTHVDKIEMKALEQIFLQMRRLQQDMLKYMALQQPSHDDNPALQKGIRGCFWSISRLLSDYAKCEENLNMLHQHMQTPSSTPIPLEGTESRHGKKQKTKLGTPEEGFHERYLKLKREEIDQFVGIEEKKLEDPYSINKCITMLEGINGLQMGDILVASDIFKCKDNREIFLSFTSDALRFAWITREIGRLQAEHQN